MGSLQRWCLCAVALAVACLASGVGNREAHAVQDDAVLSCHRSVSHDCNVEVVRRAGPFRPSGIRLISVSRPVYVLGDSLTYGVNLNGFEDLAIQNGLDLVVSDGVPGRRIDQGVEAVRAWRELEDNALVLVALGTNDIFRHPHDAANNARELIEAIDAPTIIWVDVASDVLGTGNALNGELEIIADADPRVTLAKWSDWEAAHGIQRSYDGVHYNAAEYSARAEFYVNELVSQAFQGPVIAAGA